MATTNKKLDPTNQNLVLPDYNEKADINVINSNFTKAADAVNTLNSNLSELTTYMKKIYVPPNGSASLSIFSPYSVAIIIGLAQGQGQICVIANGTSSGVDVKNLFDGSAYSGTKISITRQPSVNSLVFTNSYSQASDFLVIYSGR